MISNSMLILLFVGTALNYNLINGLKNGDGKKNDLTSLSTQACSVTSLTLCRCKNLTQAASLVVDCSHIGLIEVPDDYPKHTTRLDLGFNNISTIPNFSFVGKSRNHLENLKHLSLSDNNLTFLGEKAFNGLIGLETLVLYNNNLYAAFQTSPLIFSPLRNSLRVLDVRKNIKEECIKCQRYPGSTLKVLENLTELYMDAIDGKSLDMDFQYLRELRKLVFAGGRGHVVHIQNTMFRSVSMITELDMSGIGVGSIWGAALKFLPNLKVLNLCNNPSLREHVVNIGSALKWVALEKLYMNNTGVGDSMDSFMRAVTTDTMTGEKMKVLTLDSNSIYDVNFFFSKRFPNLEVLSLGDNYLNPQSKFFADFFDMHPLVGLNMSWQQGSSYATGTRQKRHAKWMKGRWDQNELHFCQLGTACPLNLPRRLEWVDLSHFGFQLPQVPEMALLTNSSLKYLNLAFTGIRAIPFMVFCPASLRVVPQIETLDFTGNSVECINSSFLRNCTMDTLENLYLGKNNLGWTGDNSCNNEPYNHLAFFKPFPNLKSLDLHENNLAGSIPKDVFLNNTKLRHINLAANGITDFNLSIDHLLDLDTLNLAGNDLRCLSEETFRALEHLQRNRNGTFRIQIDLSQNPLTCNCSYLPFYEWLVRTEVDVANMRDYQCQFPDGSTMKLRRLNTILAKLYSSCSGTGLIEMAWSVAALINFAVTIGTVAFRFRHEIRYMWLKMRMRRQRLDELLGQHEYKYDAFISCDARDAAKYVKNGILLTLETKETALSFCVAQRNFLVGATIIDNIIRAIYSSRKVVLLITPNFLTSGWCKEELLIAHNESLSRGKNILICIFTPEVRQCHLPDNIKMITRTVTCLRYPDNVMALKIFYLMLHRALTDGLTDK